MIKGYSFSRLAAWSAVRAAGALGARAAQEGRPVFVISMPRSGSSWVGSVLGKAQSARYIREPFTRTRIAHQGGGAGVVPVDPEDLPATYAQTARKLHAGQSDFRPSVIGHTDQWPPFQRGARRMVVKEVNPLACKWFIDEFEPHLILLFRHPAAIAQSYLQRGWGQPEDGSDRWSHMGQYVAQTWADMLDQTAAYPHKSVVRYETLCAEPMKEFRSLFEQVDLPWDSQIEAYLEELGAPSAKADAASAAENSEVHAYSLTRPTDRMANNWRRNVDAAQLSSVLASFRQTSLPALAQYGD